MQVEQQMGQRWSSSGLQVELSEIEATVSCRCSIGGAAVSCMQVEQQVEQRWSSSELQVELRVKQRWSNGELQVGQQWAAG